jgi:hypothetical protein
MISDAVLRLTESDGDEGSGVCDEASAAFAKGLLLCSSEAEVRDELKLLLVEVMTVVHKTPTEGVLSKAYKEVVDATDSGHVLWRSKRGSGSAE